MTFIKMKPAAEASIEIDKNLKRFFENFNPPNFGEWGIKTTKSNSFSPG